MKMKLTKEQIEEIRELKKQGLKTKEIREKFGISQATVNYWTNEEVRDKQKKKSVNWFRKLPREKKTSIYKKRKEYLRKYYKNRYNNDEEFRQMQIEAVKRSTKKRAERRVK